jgi:hypothetical protein
MALAGAVLAVAAAAGIMRTRKATRAALNAGAHSTGPGSHAQVQTNNLPI